jgi:hypothetical protein
MKSVLRHIMQRRRQFTRTPFFARLADESIPARERLAFLPAMAHFILSFGDLNRYVLRYDDPRSALEHAINAHTEEDATHWPWYLEDLSALDLDAPQSRANWLRDCWSAETAPARTLTYTLIGLITGTTPQERIALIEVMEETGNAVFAALVPLATCVELEIGARLPFCGKHHLERETGHTLSLDHRELAAITLDEATRVRVLDRVDAAFAAFDRFLQAVHEYALRRAAPRRAAPPRSVPRGDQPPNGR